MNMLFKIYDDKTKTIIPPKESDGYFLSLSRKIHYYNGMTIVPVSNLHARFCTEMKDKSDKPIFDLDIVYSISSHKHYVVCYNTEKCEFNLYENDFLRDDCVSKTEPTRTIFHNFLPNNLLNCEHLRHHRKGNNSYKPIMRVYNRDTRETIEEYNSQYDNYFICNQNKVYRWWNNRKLEEVPNCLVSYSINRVDRHNYPLFEHDIIKHPSKEIHYQIEYLHHAYRLINRQSNEVKKNQEFYIRNKH